jgi:hypothetical protein
MLYFKKMPLGAVLKIDHGCVSKSIEEAISLIQIWNDSVLDSKDGVIVG